MTPEQQAETIEIQQQMHAYLDTLIVAGCDPRIVVTAALVAASERVLKSSGSPTQTAAWLRGQALAMEKLGPALIEAMRAG